MDAVRRRRSSRRAGRHRPDRSRTSSSNMLLAVGAASMTSCRRLCRSAACLTSIVDIRSSWTPTGPTSAAASRGNGAPVREVQLTDAATHAQGSTARGSLDSRVRDGAGDRTQRDRPSATCGRRTVADHAVAARCRAPILSRLLPHARWPLLFVTPATLLRWHLTGGPPKVDQ
jgi:hypothetical protein